MLNLFKTFSYRACQQPMACNGHMLLVLLLVLTLVLVTITTVNDNNNRNDIEP